MKPSFGLNGSKFDTFNALSSTTLPTFGSVAPTAANNPPSQGGFNFGASAASPPSFSFGSNAPQSTAPAFGASAEANKTSASFAFGTGSSTPAMPNQFLGAPQAQAQQQQPGAGSMFNIGAGPKAPSGRTIVQARRRTRR